MCIRDRLGVFGRYGTSKFAVGVIGASLITGNLDKAQKYYKKFEKDLSVQDRERLGERIKDRVRTAEADFLLNKFINESGGDLDKAGRKIASVSYDDAELNQEIKDKFSARKKDHKKREKERIDSIVTMGNDKITSALAEHGVVKDVEKVIGDDLILQIPKEKKAGLMKAFRRFSQRGTETNPNKMSKFKQMHKEDLLKMTKDEVFMEFTSYFSAEEDASGGSDYAWAMREWADAKRLQGKRHGKTLRDTVIDRLHKAGLISNKLKEGKTSKVDAALVKKVKPLVEGVIPTLRQENKTANELWSEALDTILIQAWRDDLFFDNEFLLGELTTEQIRSDDFYVELKNIPANDLSNIRDSFRQAGKTPTDKDLGRVFVAMKKKDWELVDEIMKGVRE